MADRQRLAFRLVDSWLASTRDNYLGVFAKFARFMAFRGLGQGVPFHFAPEHLYAFVDMLLSRSPTGQAQLKVSTVWDHLSAVRVCFFQAGLPELIWPETALRLVRAENS